MDFRVFYCAGAAAIEHVDPYYVEPVRSCEHRVQPNARFNQEFPAWAGMPAPYPGYVIALYALFANVDFSLARAVWDGLLVAALTVAAFALSELSGIPIGLVALILVPTALLHNLKLGAPPPLAMAGLTLAALAFARGRPALAAPGLSAAMIDPHLALPSVIAFIWLAPSARVACAVCGCVLFGLSLLAIGITGNFEFFLQMLPMQARTEVFDRYQYSLTHLLAVCGIPVNTALAVGSISYIALAAVGVAFALRQTPDAIGRARAILIPVAFVSLGGTFLHHQQIALALPAALVVVRSARTRTQRLLLWIAFVGLLFSPGSEETRTCIVAYILACGAAAAAIWPRRAVPAFGFSASIAAGLLFVVLHLPQTQFTDTIGSVRPASLRLDVPSNRPWTDFLAASPATRVEDSNSFASKLPTWIGIVALLAVALSTQSRPTQATVLGDGADAEPQRRLVRRLEA